MSHIRALPEDTELVNFCLRAATAACEDYTGRVFVTHRFKLTMSGWPIFSTSERAIVLPRSPLVGIVSVKYWPETGAQITWDAANYVADVTTLPGRLVVVDGVSLPSTATRPDAVEIEFDAGHGTEEKSMPANYLMAMLLLARHFFDNPSAVDPTGVVSKMPLSFQHLLRSQKI